MNQEKKKSINNVQKKNNTVFIIYTSDQIKHKFHFTE